MGIHTFITFTTANIMGSKWASSLLLLGLAVAVVCDPTFFGGSSSGSQSSGYKRRPKVKVIHHKVTETQVVPQYVTETEIQQQYVTETQIQQQYVTETETERKYITT